MTSKIQQFYPVDNAGQIFIPIHSPKEPTISRISVTLNESVKIEQLQKALEITIKRFPFFQVYLKKTFFRFIFEHTNDIPQIEEDTGRTNRYVNFMENNFLFRIRALEKTVAIELSHALSDGYGTLSFLLTLIAQYFEIQGNKIDTDELIKNVYEPIDKEEWQCGYRNTFSPKGPKQKIFPPAYIPKNKMIPVEKYYSTRIFMDLEDIRSKARKMNTTLNVYMSAIYAESLQELFFEDIKNGSAKSNLPIRVQIPVNLRKYYPTKTLKNFSYVYSPSFNSGEHRFSFKEIVTHISNSIRHERHSGSLENQISRNLRLEKNFFFRFTPLPLKNLLFRFFYFLFSRNLYSGILTNLGDIILPSPLEQFITGFNVLPGNSHFLGRITALYSYKGKLEMNIGSSCSDLRLENTIIKKLKELSIQYEVIYKRDDKSQP